MPVELSHFKIDNKTHLGREHESRSRSSRSTGARAWTWSSISILTTDRARISESRLPSGPSPMAGSIRKRLADPATRPNRRMRCRAKLESIGQNDYSYATVAALPADRSYDGKTIPESRRHEGQPENSSGEIETILEMMR